MILLLWACGASPTGDSGASPMPDGAYADCVVASEESAADADAEALLALVSPRVFTGGWGDEAPPEPLAAGLTLDLQASVVPATLVRREARVEGATCTDSLRVPVRGQVSLADGTVLLRHPWVQGTIEAPLGWSSLDEVELRLVGEGEAVDAVQEATWARVDELVPGLDHRGAELTLRLVLSGHSGQGQAVLFGFVSIAGGGGVRLRLWAGAC